MEEKNCKVYEYCNHAVTVITTTRSNNKTKTNRTKRIFTGKIIMMFQGVQVILVHLVTFILTVGG